MLLDPFEEKFHLPAAVVQLGDRQCRQGEVVGQEDVVTCLQPRVERDTSRL